MSIRYLDLSGAVNFWTNIKNFILSKIPTKTSELTNDSGFLTQHQSLSNYVTLNSEQTITGKKLFTNSTTKVNSVNTFTGSTQFIDLSTTVPRGAFPAEAHRVGRVYIGDNTSYNGSWFIIDPTIDTDKAYYRMVTTNPDNTDSTRFSITWDSTKEGARRRRLACMGDLICATNNTYQIGESGNVWKDAYINKIHGISDYTNFLTSALNANTTLTHAVHGRRVILAMGAITLTVPAPEEGSWFLIKAVNGLVTLNLASNVTVTGITAGVFSGPIYLQPNESILLCYYNSAIYNATISTIRRSGVVGRTGNVPSENPKHWFKIAENYVTATYRDPFICLKVFESTTGNTIGTLCAHCRINNTIGVVDTSNCYLQWQDAGAGFNLSKYALTTNETSGTGVTITLWCKLEGGYSSIKFEVVSEYGQSDQLGNPEWVLTRRRQTDGDIAELSDTDFTKIVYSTLTTLKNDTTGKASNVTGTVAIANGGTGATSRLSAIKNLTNESVGTPTYFLGLTTNYAKCGYTSIAQAKTVLGITGDIVSHSDSEYVHKTGNETISGEKTFGNGTLIVDNGTGNNVHGEIKLNGTRPVYINADNSEDGLFANTSCGMSILLNDSSKSIHIGGITTGNNGRKIIKTSEKVPYLTLGTQEVGTQILVPENDTADSAFSITSTLKYASGASAKSFTVKFRQSDNGSSGVFPVANNKTDLGLSGNRWKGIYATNYYYGSDAVEFSTKFVTTDTTQTITGVKTFASSPLIYNSDTTGSVPQLTFKNSKTAKGSTTETGAQLIYFADKNNAPLSMIESRVVSNGCTTLSTVAYNFNDSQNVSSSVQLIKNPTTAYYAPGEDNDISLGRASARWLGVYATNYYYGADNTEFSTKFVTTDTNQTISGAKTFSSTITGSITGNASTATEFSANKDVTLTGDVTGTASSKAGWSVSTTLSNSGVTAGTYGPSEDVTGNNNATITVPEITVDSKGRVTSVTNRKLTCKNNTYNVYNKTLTIQKNGTNVATFTSNSNTNVTANITVPTKTSELTNDSNFLTTSSSLNASKLTGTIDIARLPQGALERVITVANQTARFALTTSSVQLGDTVKQLDTGVMYVVVNESKLNSNDGYLEYTAGSASSVPWSGITSKPTEFTPSSHTHTKSEITDFPTNVSAFTNDAGYLTSHQSLANYVTLDGNQTISGTKTFSSTITGSVSGNAGTATQFSANTTVALTGDATGTSAGSKKGWSVPVTLANSGVTAGTYGPSADVTGSNNATISVPEITVDAKGRVTSVTNRTYTSVNTDSDKKVYQYYKSDDNVYRLLFSNNSGNTSTSNVGAVYSGLNNSFYVNPSTGALYATKLYSNGVEVLTAHQSLSNYVTLNTAQEITNAKTFKDATTVRKLTSVEAGNVIPTSDKLISDIWQDKNGKELGRIYFSKTKGGNTALIMRAGDWFTSNEGVYTLDASGTNRRAELQLYTDSSGNCCIKPNGLFSTHIKPLDSSVYLGESTKPFGRVYANGFQFCNASLLPNTDVQAFEEHSVGFFGKNNTPLSYITFQKRPNLKDRVAIRIQTASSSYKSYDFDATCFYPESSNSVDIGSTTNIFKNIYCNNYYLGTTAFGDIVTHNASEFLTSHQSLSSCVKNVVTNNQTIKSTGITRGTAPSSAQTFGIAFSDNNNKYIGNIYGQFATDKSTYVGLYAYKGSTTSNGDNAYLRVGYDASGNVYTSAPTPATTDNSTQIATTAFVKAQGYLTSHQSLSNYVTTNTNQSISGIKSHSKHISILGDYVGNESSTNGRSCLYLKANRDTDGKSGLYVTKFRQNVAQGSMGNSDVVFLSHDILENETRTNAGFVESYSNWADNVPGGMSIYSSIATRNLGTSAKPWTNAYITNLNLNGNAFDPISTSGNIGDIVFASAYYRAITGTSELDLTVSGNALFPAGFDNGTLIRDSPNAFSGTWKLLGPGKPTTTEGNGDTVRTGLWKRIA